jgi:hypothetical protein
MSDTGSYTGGDSYFPILMGGISFVFALIAMTLGAITMKRGLNPATWSIVGGLVLLSILCCMIAVGTSIAKSKLESARILAVNYSAAAETLANGMLTAADILASTWNDEDESEERT